MYYEDESGDYNDTLLDYPIAKNILTRLELRDLKSARLVCKSWKKYSDVKFNTMSVTQFYMNYSTNRTEEEIEDKLPPSTIIKNLRFWNFHSAELIYEKFHLLGDRFEEVSIHFDRLHDSSHILRCSYYHLQNLTKLELLYSKQSPEVMKLSEVQSPLFKEFPPIHSDSDSDSEVAQAQQENGNNVKLLLKSFSLLCYNSPFGELDPDEWNAEDFIQYLQMCPDLVELKLDLRSYKVFRNCIEKFLEIRCIGNGRYLFHNLTSLGFALFKINSASEMRILNSIFTVAPLQNLELFLHIPVESWPLVAQNLPPSVQSIKLHLGQRCFSSGAVVFQDLFRLGWDQLTNVSCIEVDCDYPCSRFRVPRANAPWEGGGRRSLPNVTRLKWALNYYEPKPGIYPTIATLFPSLKFLSVRLCARSELFEIVSAFGNLQVEDLEIYVSNHYTFSDRDILGYNLGMMNERVDSGVGDEDENDDLLGFGFGFGIGSSGFVKGHRETYEGLRGMKGLRRLYINIGGGCLGELTDRSVFVGFLSMPKLRVLEFSFPGDATAFSPKAKEALAKNKIAFYSVE